MRKSGTRTAVFLLAALWGAFLAAAPAAAEDAVQEQLKTLQQRVNELEGKMEELQDVKTRLEKIECAGVTPPEEERIKECVEKWFENNRENIIQRLTRHEEKQHLLGFDMGLTGYMTFIYQAALNRHTVEKDDGEGWRDGGRRDVLSFTFGLELTAYLTEKRNQYVFLLFEGGNGDGIDRFIPNNMGLNGDAASTMDAEGGADVTVNEAYYEGSFFDDKFVITFGKLDLTNYFDSNAVANDEMWQFASTSLINNPSIAFPDGNDAAIRALYSPFGGLDLNNEKEDASDWLLLQLGLSESNEDFNEVTSHGLLIGEAWFRPHKHPRLKNLVHGRPGNYRVGGYLNDGQSASIHDLIEETEPGNVKTAGVYLSFDQEICDNITLFTRYGKQDESVALNDRFWSYGVQLGGAMWGRSHDYIGLATAINVNNPRARFMHPQYTADERLYELYYMYHVTDFLHVTPLFQILDNPSGERGASTAVIAGLRLQFDF